MCVAISEAYPRHTACAYYFEGGTRNRATFTASSMWPSPQRCAASWSAKNGASSEPFEPRPLKYASRGRAKHRVMTSIELLARPSALLPPPRYPLTRYHGVLAPRSA